METKKFIIEVEVGYTKCDNSCPHKVNGDCIDSDNRVENIWDIFNCYKYNLATMKIKELEEEK